MTVRELNTDQLEELKQNYLSLTNENNVSYDELTNANEIVSDEMIFNYYDGITFVDDDFFCSVKQYDSNQDYFECMNDYYDGTMSV